MTVKSFDLKNLYLQGRGIKPDHIIPKFSEEDGGLKNQTSLKYFLRSRSKNDDIYLGDLLKISNLIFIWRNIAYLSDYFVTKLFTLKQFKEILNSYSQDRREINSFLESGCFIIDIDSFTKDVIVFIDRENKIILCADKKTYMDKAKKTIIDCINLDEDSSRIPDDLYILFFGSDENNGSDEDPTRYDEAYLALEDEYGYMD